MTINNMPLNATLDQITLQAGAHPGADSGMCLLEAVSYVTGEDFSDHPQAVSPVLAAYGRRLNDRLGDADRQRLKPYIHAMIGTRGDGKDARRGFIAVDCAVRVAVPRWLDLAERPEYAARLRALAPVVDETTRRAARNALRGLRYEMWEIRRTWRQKIREQVTEAIKADPSQDVTAVAVAVAVAVAAAVADAVAVAVAVADAVADAAAVAAAAADAAAVADAVADAAADAAAVAVADAAAAAAAAAAADAAADAAFGSVKYSAVWNRTYDETLPIFRAKFAENPAYAAVRAQNITDGIELLGRLIAAE